MVNEINGINGGANVFAINDFWQQFLTMVKESSQSGILFGEESLDEEGEVVENNEIDETDVKKEDFMSKFISFLLSIVEKSSSPANNEPKPSVHAYRFNKETGVWEDKSHELKPDSGLTPYTYDPETGTLVNRSDLHKGGGLSAYTYNPETKGLESFGPLKKYKKGKNL